jgi:hypothetical protein
MRSRTVLVCGERPYAMLTELAERLHLDVLPVTHFGANIEQALLADPPLCGIFDASDPHGVALCAEVRRSSLDLLTIGLIADPWGDSAREAYAAGADECIPIFAAGQLAETLLTLRTEGAPVGPVYTGTVVVAGPDREHRAALGRQLRRTGLEVEFAHLAAPAVDERLRLVVAAADVAPGGAAAALRVFRSAHGDAIPWVIFGGGPQLALRRELDCERNVAFFDLDQHASQIVFSAHQLLSASPEVQRRTVRLPYETPVRWQATEGTRWGYSYNINAGGLYVRTLVSPPAGTQVTLELRPPFGRGWVVVDGTVVWRQRYHQRQGQPPGFGVQYSAKRIALPDAAALEAGYRQLCRQHEPRPDAPCRDEQLQVSA